ncbi:hypothetical protein GQX74_008125 [Glossina fuscipes]|nr:hypothetical protein GQX74_008125 [Glossina fuscipes]
MSLSSEQKTLEYLFICKRSTPTDIFLRRHCDKRDQSPACVQYLIYEIVLVLLLFSLVAAITSHSYCHSSVSHNRVSDFDKASNMHNSEQSRHHISYPYVTRANECGQTLDRKECDLMLINASVRGKN